MSNPIKGKKRRASGAFSSAGAERPVYRIPGEESQEPQDGRAPDPSEGSSMAASIFDVSNNDEDVLNLVETKARAEKHRKRKESPEE